MTKQKYKEILLNLLSFNDVYEISPNKEGLGGLSKLSTLIKNEKKKFKNSFSFLSGDFLSASILANEFKGKHMIDLLMDIPRIFF
jgi:2',3'-cyclic-nucleotide 2'-phosphodiesterase (5'-nucleotidase family)